MKKLLLIALALVLALGSLAVAQEDVSGQFEIFSWWAGDEGPAKDALLARFEEMYPDIEVVDATVAGGSGVNARAQNPDARW